MNGSFNQPEAPEAPLFFDAPVTESVAAGDLEQIGDDPGGFGPDGPDGATADGLPSEDASRAPELEAVLDASGPRDAPTVDHMRDVAMDLAAAPARVDAKASVAIEKTLSHLPSGVPDWTALGAFELVEHHHTCGCLACSTERDESTDASGETTGGASSGASGILSDMADFLLTGYWNTGYGDGSRSHNVTNSGVDANNGVLHYNLSGYSADADGVTDARAALIREAFKLFESTLGIQFVETTSTDTGAVDFFFRDNASGAYASHSYWNSGQWGSTISYAQINVAQSWSGGTSTYDDYTFQTILHEIGHAMGLGHQGPYNGSASYGTDNVFDNDNWQSSMMSYFSQTEATAVNASYEFLQTPMAVDWLALNTIYGRQGYGTSNAFTENTIWGFNTNITSETSDVWATWSSWANRTASTIVDGGGIDTLDLSGYSNNSLINLAPSDPGATSPSVSNIGGRIGNLTIAADTIIENAIGGSGSETFYGNVASNTFTGNGGDDTFHDSAGSDRYFGGAGNDYVVFGAKFADFTYSLKDGFLQVVDAAIDWVDSAVEWLTFSDQTLSWQAVVDSTLNNAAPVANADTAATDEDVVLNGGGLLDNDTDADGDVLSVSSVEGVAVEAGGTTVVLASGASVTVYADGSFVYDQNGAFDNLNLGEQGTDSFTYRATDGVSQSQDATVSITINGAFDNTPPSANNDSFTLDENGTVSGSVLSNDSDANGDGLNVVALNGSAAMVGA
ncbi:MAG: Ig-like domain-containing protein, partial [Tateyamaria sp.]